MEEREGERSTNFPFSEEEVILRDSMKPGE
jgi:hypothetical protein